MSRRDFNKFQIISPNRDSHTERHRLNVLRKKNNRLCQCCSARLLFYGQNRWFFNYVAEIMEERTRFPMIAMRRGDMDEVNSVEP